MSPRLYSDGVDLEQTFEALLMLGEKYKNDRRIIFHCATALTHLVAQRVCSADEGEISKEMADEWVSKAKTWVDVASKHDLFSPVHVK